MRMKGEHMTPEELAMTEGFAELIKRAYLLNGFFQNEIDVEVKPILSNGNMHGYSVETREHEKHNECGVNTIVSPDHVIFTWSRCWGSYDSYRACENVQEYFDMMYELVNKHNSDENWRVFGHFRFDEERNAVEYKYSVPINKVHMDIYELSRLLGVILYKTSRFAKEVSTLEGDYLYEHLNMSKAN